MEFGCIQELSRLNRSQLQDGDCTNSWQTLTTQPRALMPPRKKAPFTMINERKWRGAWAEGEEKRLNSTT